MMVNHWQKIKSICTKDIHGFTQKKIKNVFHAFFRDVSASVVGYIYEHMNLNLRNWKIERNVGETDVMETRVESCQRRLCPVELEQDFSKQPSDTSWVKGVNERIKIKLKKRKKSIRRIV